MQRGTFNARQGVVAKTGYQRVGKDLVAVDSLDNHVEAIATVERIHGEIESFVYADRS